MGVVGGLSLFNTLCGINGFLINACKFNWARQVGVVNKKPLYRGVLSQYWGQPVKLSQYFFIPHSHVSVQHKIFHVDSPVAANNHKCIYLSTPVTSFDFCHQLNRECKVPTRNIDHDSHSPSGWKDKILRLGADFRLAFKDCTSFLSQYFCNSEHLCCDRSIKNLIFLSLK